MTESEDPGTAEHHPRNRRTKYVFYFDETENSHSVSFYEEGGNNLTLPSCGDFFIGVFIGYRTSRSDEYEKKFQEMEGKFHEMLNIEGDRMIKSTSLRRKRFVRGAASLPQTNAEILTGFLRMLDESDLKIHIVCLSKREMMIRDLFRNIVLPDFVVDNTFYANMTRYAERYCGDGFYDIIRNAEDPDDVKSYLIDRFAEAGDAA